MKNFSLFLVLSTIFLLFSCSNEEVQTTSSQTQSIDSAKIWFENNPGQNNFSLLEFADKIDWQKAKSFDYADNIIVEVPIVLKQNIFLTAYKSKVSTNRLLFIKTNNNEYIPYIINISSSKNNLDFINDLTKINYCNIPTDFTGNVLIIKNDNKNVNLNVIIDGKEKIKKDKTLSREAEISCYEIVELFDDGSVRPTGIGYCVDGGGGSYDISYTYHGGGGSGSSATNGDSIENLIITLNLNPCSESALNKLKAATGVDIAAIMNKFNSTPNYNITITTSPTSLGAAVAQTNYTNPAVPYDYTIKISPDYSSSTELFRAATLLHEITHAYFLSLKDDFNAGIQPGSNVYNDNATLFQFYVTHTYPSSYSYDAHHEEMAKKYVNSIASALQEFQTGIPVILAGAPNQIYTDLAWGGLLGTPIYNSTFLVGSSERQRIENRYACEQIGHTVGYGTPQQQNTIGKPCQ